MIEALAIAAGTAIVQAMTLDGWEQAKATLGRLWRRYDADAVAELEPRLDEGAALLTASGDEGRPGLSAALVPVWQQRLLAFLREHPEAAAELQLWADHVRASVGPASFHVQHNQAHQQGQVFAVQDGMQIVREHGARGGAGSPERE